MITAELQHDWLKQHLENGLPGSTQSDGPEWLGQLRAQAEKTAIALPAIDRKQEDWRYTSVEKLLKTRYTIPHDSAKPKDAALDLLQDYSISTHEAYSVVIINGRYMPELSNTDNLPDGVTIGSVRDMLANDSESLATWFGQTAPHTEHVFTALNTALTSDGVFIHLEKNIILEQPIELIFLAQDENNAILLQPRNLFIIDEHASATITERYIGSAETMYFHNNVSEIVMQQSATLNHYRIQEESTQAHHLSSVYLSQQSQSHYRGTTLAYGGNWNRTEYHAAFKEEDAECELNGLSIVGDQQLSDFHLKVLHDVPHCTSRERFRNILHGKGRAVFDGYIRVDKDAQHSDAQLTNDNLLLTRDAEVDTKPQLEIYADDVKCSHGTTIGELDKQQIFYLRTRGIDEVTARGMLCLGFANDIIDSIHVPELRAYAAQKLAKTLDDAGIAG